MDELSMDDQSSNSEIAASEWYTKRSYLFKWLNWRDFISWWCRLWTCPVPEKRDLHQLRLAYQKSGQYGIDLCALAVWARESDLKIENPVRYVGRIVTTKVERMKSQMD
jgi:hypothetical protein